MRTYDVMPLWKQTIGFDRLFDLVNNIQLLKGQDRYPPYDIARTGDESYRIALAGFSADEITITVQQNLLTVAARHPARRNEDVLYEGISVRPFERRFSLADHVQVEHAAFETMKPHRIEINRDGQAISSDAKPKTTMKLVGA